MIARDMQARLRRQWLLYNLRFAVPAGLLILPVLAFIVWIFAILPTQETQDLNGAIRQTETSVVTGVLWYNSRLRPSVIPGTQQVFLRVGGRDAQADSAIGFQSGQTVNVTYRVGKSGRVYVEDIHPVKQQKKTP